MPMKPLSYAHIMATADLWREISGLSKVEIGALEPLLWRDGQYRIHDVVAGLTERGYIVTMTTNGQLLDMYADKLREAGLALIRTSWHSTNPVMFKEISGGYGDYDRFLRGITLAAKSGIRIAFNLLLLKGYTEDVTQQLEFIEEHRNRLKLYTLLWTPQIGDAYERMYQDWRPIIRKYVLPRTVDIVRVEKNVGRRRLRFHLARGGTVEVKMGDALNRSAEPCVSCPYKNVCEEGFGDYVRVDPRLHLYFCYMRRDLGFPVQEFFGRPTALKERLQKAIGHVDVERLLTDTSLRLTVTPFCNFNCRMPGEAVGWCMEEPGDFVYPNIRPTLFGK